MFKHIGKALAAIGLALALVGCGQGVEVPPAHVGKIMGPDGYQPNLIPTSKFRLAPCWAYCDKLVLLDVADKAYSERLKIFIPEDKLNLTVNIQTTLSVNPKRTQELFGSLSPEQRSDGVMLINSERIYRTYAAQIIQKEAREYLSQYSISQIASSNEKVNADLQLRLSKTLEERTPFNVRYVGITNIEYPKIITDAQEAAAERREAVQQEEAQLEISKVKLERELQEARLTRAIEKEKAEIEALAQRTLAESVDARVLELRRLENQRAWIDRWDGKQPQYMLGENAMMMFNGK